MEITIKLTSHEASHLSDGHSFMDECEEACGVLYKVQKAINKQKNLSDKKLRRAMIQNLWRLKDV